MTRCSEAIAVNGFGLHVCADPERQGNQRGKKGREKGEGEGEIGKGGGASHGG